jgi:DNA-binding response OmpR family regulator
MQLDRTTVLRSQGVDLVSVNNGRYTATEHRILARLSDGLPHSREDLLKCLEDSQAELATLQVHISNIRKKLPTGYRIVCELHKNSPHYTHVRKLAGDEE